MAIKIALFVLPVVLAVVIYSIPTGAKEIVNPSNSVTFNERHERAAKFKFRSRSKSHISAKTHVSPVHRPASTRRQFHSKPKHAKHTKKLKLSGKTNRKLTGKKKKPLKLQTKKERKLTALKEFSEDVAAAALKTFQESLSCREKGNETKVAKEVEIKMKMIWNNPGTCYYSLPPLVEDTYLNDN